MPLDFIYLIFFAITIVQVLVLYFIHIMVLAYPVNLNVQVAYQHLSNAQAAYLLPITLILPTELARFLVLALTISMDPYVRLANLHAVRVILYSIPA